MPKRPNRRRAHRCSGRLLLYPRPLCGGALLPEDAAELDDAYEWVTEIRFDQFFEQVRDRVRRVFTLQGLFSDIDNRRTVVIQKQYYD